MTIRNDLASTNNSWGCHSTSPVVKAEARKDTFVFALGYTLLGSFLLKGVDLLWERQVSLIVSHIQPVESVMPVVRSRDSFLLHSRN